MLSLWYCGIIIFKMKHKVLDLFSGIGGFSLGLQNTGGFETVAFCEIEPYCHKVLKKHWQDVPIYNDIKELTYDTLQADGIEPTVITGGFPCQDISNAGRQEGIIGERSSLWSEYARLIKDVQPTWAIIENVSALRSKGLTLVLQNLSEIGYNAEWHCIPCTAVGGLHRRDRLWIIAYLSNSSSIRQSRQRACGNACDTTQIVQREAIKSFNGRVKNKWTVEPNVGRVAYGIPQRVDRLKGLGNAVVPQIPQFLGESILNFEKENI
jgi:DNA (cytosine-5)-methyltransferase 1